MTTLTNRVRKIVKAKKANESTCACGSNAFAERVEKKAYELFEKRGGQHGSDWQDWFEAQRLVEEEMITEK